MSRGINSESEGGFGLYLSIYHKPKPLAESERSEPEL